MNRYAEADKAMSKKMAEEFGEGWIPPLPTIEIEKPLALPGDYVMFDNPRTPKAFEATTGDVMSVETSWSVVIDNKSVYKHQYTVRPRGKSYDVVVTSLDVLKSFKS